MRIPYKLAEAKLESYPMDLFLSLRKSMNISEVRNPSKINEPKYLSNV